MDEAWKPIKGYEGRYDVSTHGRVRVARTWRIVAQQYERYATVHLWKDARRHRYYVHRLVALTFLELSTPEDEVNHIDGNKLNNCVENLEFVSTSANRRHAIKTMGVYHGERHSQSKLTTDEVKAIRRSGASTMEEYMRLADKYGVSQDAIRHVIACRTWRHIDAD